MLRIYVVFGAACCALAVYFWLALDGAALWVGLPFLLYVLWAQVWLMTLAHRH